jgi:hypothetical protein
MTSTVHPVDLKGHRLGVAVINLSVKRIAAECVFVDSAARAAFACCRQIPREAAETVKRACRPG